MSEVQIVKSGEICLQAHLQRSLRGLSLEVKALPIVEDLFRTSGEGRSSDVAAYGRYWAPLREGDRLLIWDCSNEFSYTEGPYRLDLPGRPIIATPDETTPLNLSFLRLVGISDQGVSLSLRGAAYTPAHLRRISERMKVAMQRFYLDFLRPVDISVMVISQEYR